MSNTRPARRSSRWPIALSIITVACLSAVMPAAKAASGGEPPPTAAPAYLVHGTVYVPTSAANGVKCPDNTGLSTFTNGMASWLVKGVTPGRVFSLRAEDATYRNDFDIHFFRSWASCQAGEAPLPHLNHPGDEHAVVPADASVALVTLATGRPAAFNYAELPADPFRPRGRAGVTVVAIIEPFANGKGYDVYHHDFLGSHHPWNLDQDTTNDISFLESPSTYIPGLPPVTPVALELPKTDDDAVVDLVAADKAKWDGMVGYTDASPNLYWFPGTKVVAAAKFGSSAPGSGDIHGDNETHATGSASVAAGNVHGTCPECVFVLLGGDTRAALAWATKQPWIDVVTNSYIELSLPGGDTGVYAGTEYKDTKQATEAGQTVFWGAGNGLSNNQMEDPASPTYPSSQRGPDWVVTVGGVSQATEQPFRGSGRPADIASYADGYPSAGGATVSTHGTFTGTSNASPVVAGTFAKIIALGRQLLGDKTPGHANGVVATGTAVACAPSSSSSAAPCPLGDGVLHRAEVQSLLFANVVPNPADVTPDYVDQGTQPDRPGVSYTATSGPATEFRPATEGHGIVYGRLDPNRFVAEQRRFSDALLGAIVPLPRPPEEAAWMTVDSKCRQQLWGRWDGGIYTGKEPTFTLPDDAAAQAVHTVCSQLPPDLMLSASPFIGALSLLVGQ